MALQNHPALYTGGNERLNSRPHTMLYAQLMQREKANRDAFDEYIRNLNMKINPAGMRNNEIPVFNEELKKFEEMGVRDREALRNPRKDGGLASMRFQSQYQKIQNIIARSKGIEGLKKPGVEVITDLNKYDRANKEKLKQGFYDNDQDLYVRDETGELVDNPNWKPFNPAEHIEYDAKPFEQDKFFKGLDDVKPSQSTEAIIKNKDLTNTVVTTAVFGSKDKDVIASRAVAEYVENKAFKSFVEQLDPSEYNDIHKDAFGTDIQDYGDLAAAYALKGKQQQHTTTKIEDDKFAQSQAMARLRHRLAVELKKTPGAKPEGSEDDNLYIQEWVRGASEKATRSEVPKDVLRGGGAPIKGQQYPMQLHPMIKTALKSKNVEPDEVLVRETADGEYEYQPKYYEDVYVFDKDGKAVLGKDGNYEKKRTLIPELSKTMSETDFLLNMGVKLPPKQKVKEAISAVKGGQPQPKPKNDPLGIR